METTVNVYSTNTTPTNPSRHELLAWVNKTLKTDIKKIEHLCTAAAYCQLLDMVFPGSISMNKVKFMTNVEYDCIQNFKLLQFAFAKKGVQKVIFIDRLAQGRFQDNLEFLQWFKRFFDANVLESNEYDPIAARGGVRLNFGQSVLKGSKYTPRSPHPRRPRSEGDATMKFNKPVKVATKPVALTDRPNRSAAVKEFGLSQSCVPEPDIDLREMGERQKTETIKPKKKPQPSKLRPPTVYKKHCSTTPLSPAPVEKTMIPNIKQGGNKYGITAKKNIQGQEVGINKRKGTQQKSLHGKVEHAEFRYMSAVPKQTKSDGNLNTKLPSSTVVSKSDQAYIAEVVAARKEYDELMKNICQMRGSYDKINQEKILYETLLRKAEEIAVKGKFTDANDTSNTLEVCDTVLLLLNAAPSDLRELMEAGNAILKLNQNKDSEKM